MPALKTVQPHPLSKINCHFVCICIMLKLRKNCGLNTHGTLSLGSRQKAKSDW